MKAEPMFRSLTMYAISVTISRITCLTTTRNSPQRDMTTGRASSFTGLRSAAIAIIVNQFTFAHIFTTETTIFSDRDPMNPK